ncbi:hypothetical protein [Pontivivens nitratireducens]|uniref:hypothetical protein n=1 Tax=Pontivivens nitratireducens TaxID=2758038 RepID=UPI00163A2588|nr:hypothetical protein [Pontibrevibacter nitratireducens]
MGLESKTAFPRNIAQKIPADPILSFVSEHREGLWHAARLLGGYESARLVDRCVELLANDGRLTPRTWTMLGQILALLSLDYVDDPDLPYIGYFASIDPRDRVVEEICLLTDGLRRALENVDVGAHFRSVA